MKFKILSLLSITLVFFGCATGYHRDGLSGGYSDIKLQEGLYKVSFRGNGYTRSQRASNFALLRAAELALQNGYPFFIIREGQTNISADTFTTPVTAQTTGNANLVSSNLGGGTTIMNGNYSGTTYYSGGQTYNVSRPDTSLLIECLKEKPENYSGIVYEAAAIQENLRSQYKLKVAPIIVKAG